MKSVRDGVANIIDSVANIIDDVANIFDSLKNKIVWHVICASTVCYFYFIVQNESLFRQLFFKHRLTRLQKQTGFTIFVAK